VQIPSRIIVGDHVVDEEHVTGFNLPGSPSELQAVAIYKVRDEMICSVVLIS
jgi:hypothetical protein